MGSVLVSVATAARSDGFRDDFASLDPERWVTITRPFGHGAVDAANVAVTGGLLGVKLPAGRLDGGEVRTTSLYRFGSFRARMKVANAPSSLTAFFLYKAPDYQSELDIEILSQGSRGILGVGGEEARILAAPKSAVAAAETVREAAPEAAEGPPPARARS